MKITGPALISLALMLTACGSDSSDIDASADVAVEKTVDAVESMIAETGTTTPTTTTAAPATTAPPTTAPPTSAATAQPAGGFTLNGFRYCEILMTVEGKDGADVTEVWGTPGVDPCTDEAWYALDPEAIRVENEASFIEMNGPRYFVVDGTADTGDGSGGTGTAAGGAAVSRQFGDITMNLLATTEVSEDSEPWATDLVERTTTWTFEAGTEIYELTDPDGNVYVMQSYSQILDRSLDATDLPTLGDRLALPNGWSYGSRTLDEPLQVALAPEGAYVVQDDLRNAYQRNG